jgi:hypothetical protein
MAPPVPAAGIAIPDAFDATVPPTPSGTAPPAPEVRLKVALARMPLLIPVVFEPHTRHFVRPVLLAHDTLFPAADALVPKTTLTEAIWDDA